MQSPGKKQESEHAVKKHPFKVDPLDDIGRPRLDTRFKMPQGNQAKRNNRPAKHQGDGIGKMEISMIQIAEECGEGNQDGYDIKKIH